MRFRDQDIVFAGGARGENFKIPTANPVNSFHVISHPADLPRLAIDGKMLLPATNDRRRNGKLPLVMVVPGSLGVAPAHLAHAETAVGDRFAAFVLDAFGARDVTSTVANQTQFSFAASAYDVLAAWQVLSGHPEIDASRIGAQGHSRGGSAVLMAATRRFADAVVGAGAGFRSVLAAYPWSGHQFLVPFVDETEIRVLMGDADEWCSPMQVQGHCQAIRLSGGRATMRLIGGAPLSFDRGTGIENVADTSVFPAEPTAYIANDGAFIHPLNGVADSAEGRLCSQGRENRKPRWGLLGFSGRERWGKLKARRNFQTSRASLSITCLKTASDTKGHRVGSKLKQTRYQPRSEAQR